MLLRFFVSISSFVSCNFIKDHIGTRSTIAHETSRVQSNCILVDVNTNCMNDWTNTASSSTAALSYLSAWKLWLSSRGIEGDYCKIQFHCTVPLCIPVSPLLVCASPLTHLQGLEIAPLTLPYFITLLVMDCSGSGLSEGDFISLGYFEKDDVGAVVQHLREGGTVSKIGRRNGHSKILPPRQYPVQNDFHMNLASEYSVDCEERSIEVYFMFSLIC